jgi:hypothetical protein
VTFGKEKSAQRLLDQGFVAYKDHVLKVKQYSEIKEPLLSKKEKELLLKKNSRNLAIENSDGHQITKRSNALRGCRPYNDMKPYLNWDSCGKNTLREILVTSRFGIIQNYVWSNYRMNWSTRTIDDWKKTQFGFKAKIFMLSAFLRFRSKK